MISSDSVTSVCISAYCSIVNYWLNITNFGSKKRSGMTFPSDSLSVIFELLRCTRSGVYEEGAVSRLGFNTPTGTWISGI